MSAIVRLIGLAMLLMAHGAAARELRVCADPNNLPFSNRAREGFENRIVELIAQELDVQVRYVWWAQRRGIVRNTLTSGLCDLIPGVGSGSDMLATTRPYYRSAYVFVTRRDRHLDVASFDDERLKTLTVGVQLIGDDGANTPPAHELSRRGIVENVRGYMVYGDYEQADPARTIVADVASGNIDIAVVWGPTAGYFGKRSSATLRIVPVTQDRSVRLPMSFDVSMGVRREDRELLRQLDDALSRQRHSIGEILAEYAVPGASLNAH